MRDVIYLLFHLLTTLAKLIGPGSGRAVIAENLILRAGRIDGLPDALLDRLDRVQEYKRYTLFLESAR
ncbi:MAG: hypothetical protein V7754_22040 [Halioglobus sp.]